MAPPSLSRSAIDSLGKRLRRAEIPSLDDLRQLAAFQQELTPTLDIVLRLVREIAQPSPGGGPVRITHRMKTAETLVDKLRRGTSLSSMQDVAGVRVVGAFGLGGQDEIVGRLLERFPEARCEDRRVRPNHGYRAVHVIPRLDGFQVEIQVRTAIQHAWAHATERLADHWGRGIRYGGLPTGKGTEEVERRAQTTVHWIHVAERIAELESVEAVNRGAADVPMARLAAALDAADPEVAEMLQAELERWR